MQIKTTMRYHLTPFRMTIIKKERKKITSVGEGVEKLEPLWKDWCWSWSSNTLATWCEELTHWKRLWHWERLKVGGEGDDRGWDVWMASPTWWTWVKQALGVGVGIGDGQGSLACCSPWGRKVGHNWVTELNWTELMPCHCGNGTVENRMAVPQKMKINLPYNPAILPLVESKRTKTRVSKRHLYTHVHSSLKVQTVDKRPLTDEWINKMRYIHTWNIIQP